MLPVLRSSVPLLLLAAAAPGVQAQGAALDRAPSRFASYQGIRLHYKSLGVGPAAVVFIHGWTADLSVWRGQVPAVDGRVHAVFLDLPGFGRSDKPAVAYTMDYFAGAVQAVMLAAGVERAVLVGHSMGTPVARQFYRKFPAKVIALVLVDGPLRSFFKDTVEARPFLAQLEGPDFPANLSRLLDQWLGPAADSALRASVKRMAMATPRRVAVSSMREMIDPAIWRDDPIDVPVLAVMAPNPAWTPEYVTYVKRLASRVRYETMSGVGHFLMMQRPAEFNLLLGEFLRSLRVTR